MAPLGLYKPISGRPPARGKPHLVGHRGIQEGLEHGSSDVLVLLCFFFFEGTPSAPRDLSYEIIGSTVLLTWRLPKDLGGRKNVFFNVICKVCPTGSPGPCVRCGDSVQFEPRQVGLTESRVQVANLLARVQYTFEVQAVNLVTELSPNAPQYAAINVSTSQSGEPNSFGRFS